MHNQTVIQYWGGYRSYLWLRVITAYLKCRGTAPARQANRKPPINGAALQFGLTCLTSPTGPTLRRTRHSGKIRPLYSTGGLGYQSYLWLREITAHLKWRGTAPTRQANRKRPINGAAHQFGLTCLTSPTGLTCPTKRRTRHSGTIRPFSSTGGSGNQSYLWLREITAHLKCRGTAPTRQANRKHPINDGGAPIKSDKSDRSDRSDQAPHQTLRQNQTAFQYWGAGLSVIPLAARDYRTIRPFSSTGGKKKNLSDECESLKGSKKNSRHRATLP